MADRRSIVDELLGRNEPTKEQQVERASIFKKQALAKRSAANDPVEVNQPSPIDPYKQDPAARYNSLEEFRANEGPADINTIRRFNDQENAGLRDRARAGQREQARVDDKAWMDTTEQGSVGGNAKQIGSALAQGSARLSGEVSGLPFNMAGTQSMVRVDDKAREIYGRLKQNELKRGAIAQKRNQIAADGIRGKLSPEDVQNGLALMAGVEQSIESISDEDSAYLDQAGKAVTSDLRNGGSNYYKDRSNRELMDDAFDNFDTAEGLNAFFNKNEFIDGLMNPVNAKGLSKDLGASYDKHTGTFKDAKAAYEKGDTTDAVITGAKGLVSLIGDQIGDLISNPQAVAEHLAQTAPELALGMGGGGLSKALLGTTNLSYGMDLYRKSLAEFEKREGRIANQSESSQMLVVNLSAAVADYAMDSRLVAPFLKGKAGQVAAEVTKAQAVTGTLKGVLKRTGSAAGTGAGEYITEGYQSAVEEGLGSLTTDIDGKNVAEGAAIGLGASSPMGVTGELVDAKRDAKVKIQKQQAEKQKQQQKVNKSVGDMIAEGNIEKVLDDDVLATQDVEAAGKAILQVAGHTGDRIAKDKVDTARGMLDRLDQRADSDIKDLKAVNERFSKKNKDKFTGLLQGKKEALQDYKLDGNKDAVERVTGEIATIENELKKINADDRGKAKARDARIARLGDMQRKIAETQKLATANVTNTPDAGKRLVVLDDATATPEARSTAAKEMVTLAMDNPDMLDIDTAKRLADDPTLDIPENQRSYLRALSARKQVDTNLKGYNEVRQDVFTGDTKNGFRSLPEYRTMFSRAMKTNNPERAGVLMDQLGKFQTSHERKAEALRKAVSQAKETGKQVQVVAQKLDDGTVSWEINDGRKLKDADLTKNGGLNINAKLGKMADTLASIKLEGQAITATQAELQAMQTLSLGESPVAPVTEQPEVVATPEDTASPVVTEEPSSGQTEAAQTLPETAEQATPATTESAPTEQASIDTYTDADRLAVEVNEAGVDSDPVAEPENEPTSEAAPVDDRTTASVESVLDVDRTDAEPVEGQLPLERFQSENLKQAYIKTKKGLPLTSVKNYLSNVLAQAVNSPESLGDKLSTDPTVKVAQQKLLARFVEEAQRWNGLMDGLMQQDTNAKFQYTNMLNYYTDGNGNLEENIKTAISAALFSFVQDNGNDLWTNTDDAMKAILNMDSAESLGINERNLVQNIGTREDNVIADLGIRITQALGQSAYKDAPANHMTQVEGAFGALALAVMLEAGADTQTQALVQRNGLQDAAFGLDKRQIQTVKGNPAKGIKPVYKQAYPTQWFVRSNKVFDKKTGEWVKNPYLMELLDVSKGTQGFLNGLFSIEATTADVVDTAPTEAPQTTKRTKQKTSNEQREILTAAQKQEHFPRTDMLEPETGLMHKLGRDFLLRMEGHQEIDLETTQVNLVEAQRGKNNSAERTVDGLFTFGESREGRMAQPFFFKRFVAKQQRVHLDSRVFNPQENKLHRINFTQTGWEMTVPVDFSGETGFLFKHTVGEAMGYKVGNMTPDQVLTTFDVIQADPKVISALEVLADVDASNKAMTVQQEADLMAALKEKSWSLDALWHLHQWNKALDTNQTTFVSTLHAEGDGRSNGAMFTLAQTGTLSTDVGAAGGFFTKEQGYVESSDWASEAGNLDPYETMGYSVDAKMANAAQHSEETRQMNALVHNLLGDFVADGEVTPSGRNAFKYPYLRLMFGAGKKRSASTMGEVMIEKMYEKVQKLMKTSPNDAEIGEQIGTLYDTLNYFLGKGQQITAKHTYDGARRFTLTEGQAKQLVKKFTELVGPHIEETIDEQYQDTLDRRESLNGAANLSFKLYKLVYDFEKARMLASVKPATRELVDKKGNKTGEVEVLQDLTKAQEADLQKRLKAVAPLVHTAMSKGGDLDAGLKMAKTRTVSGANKDAAHSGRVRLNHTIKMSSADLNKDLISPHAAPDPTVVKAIDYSSNTKEEVEPGVAMVVSLIHSMDSAVISRVYKMFNVLNVHDAAIGSPEQLVKVIQKMNQETVNALIDWSLSEELMQAMFRTMEGFDDYVANLPAADRQTLDNSLQELMKTYQKKDAPMPTRDGLAGQYLKDAEAADRDAMLWLKHITQVSQYGYPGSSYAMSDTDYAKIEARLGTTIAQRIEARSAKRKAKNPGKAAAVLREFLEDAEQKFENKILKENTVSEPGKHYVRNLRLVNKIYVQTGSLDQALGRVFKGDENKSERDAMRDVLLKRLGHSNTRQKSLTHAPAGRVLGMLQAASQSPYIDAALKPVLQAVHNNLMTLGSEAKVAETPMDKVMDTALWLGTQNEKQFNDVKDLLTRMYNGYQQTPWGTLSGRNKPVTNEQAPLLEALQAKPRMTVRELIPAMRRALSAMPKDDKQRAVLGQVLARVLEQGNLDVEVQYVTQETPISLAPEMQNPGRIRGMWHRDAGGKETIFIKGPDFLESNVTVELLAHELLHSLLRDTVAAELHAKRANPKHNDPAVSPHVSELMALRKQAAELIKGDPALELKYLNAVENLDELMSWGMTNKGFQEDVLNQIEMKSRNSKRGVVTGLKAFIEAITGLFTRGKPTAGLVSGVEILVSNTAALMEASKAAETRVITETLAQASPDPVQEVEGYTTEQVYNSLEGTDTGRPRNVLDKIVETLHGPGGGVKAFVDNHTALSPEDAYLEALASDQMPFVTKATAAGLGLTDKELFVLEQAEASLQAAADPRTSAYRELVKLFQAARAQVTPEMLFAGDWSKATRAEKEKAQNTHAFIFDIQKTSEASKSDHLTRFGALALVYSPLIAAMDFDATPDNEAVSDKLGDRIQSLFNKGMQQFSDYANGTRASQSAQERMDTVLIKLVQTEKRRKVSIAKDKISLIDELEEANQQAGGKLRGAIAKASRSKTVQDSKSSTVRLTGKIVEMTAEDRLHEFLDEAELFRSTTFRAREDFATSMVNEVRGPAEDTKPLLDLLNEYGNQQREKMTRIGNTKQHLMDMFGDAAKSFSKTDKQSLTKVLLKTDITVLLDRYGIDEVTQLVNDDPKVRRKIREVESELRKVTKAEDYNYYVNQAEALGLHIAVGGAHSPWLQFNATQIAQQAGMPNARKVTQAQITKVLPLIDQLASLHALSNTASESRRLAGDILTDQLARGDQNGAVFMINVHKDQKKQALASNFENDPALMMKGFIKEIYDPKREVETAVKDSDRAKRFEKMGYVRQNEPLKKDVSDPDKASDEYLYVLKDGGLPTWVTGAISYAGMRAKGNTVHGGRYSVSMDETLRMNERANQQILVDRQSLIHMLYQPNALQAFKNQTFMAPVTNQRGEATNWRYLMTEQHKDDLMNRDTTFDNVMGAMDGAIYEKMTAAVQNEKVMQALKDQYDTDDSRNSVRYIAFGPDAADKDIREMYDLLPNSTKMAMRKIWGSDQVMVRNDTLNMVFGYRQYSLAEIANKDAEARNYVEKLIGYLMEKVFGEGAAKRIQKYQDIWEGMVRERKDFYVIKNLWTLVGNELSNASILLWEGITPKRLLEDKKVAIDGLLRYDKDYKEKMRLERLQRVGSYTGTAKQLEQKIRELDHAINTNPVKHLIDGGQFQTIMEDLDNEDDQFSYKSRLTEWVDDKTKKVPKGMMTVGRWAYMTHDTQLYRLLHKSTQMSDFTSRYSLYQHLTTRKLNPLSDADAMFKIKETFINYDVATHKGLDFMNKVGLVMFTKYYLRAQRILLGLYKDKPVRALLMILFSQFFESVTTVQDSGALGRIGNNPFDTGAIGMPGAIKESIVMQAILSPFN